MRRKRKNRKMTKSQNSLQRAHTKLGMEPLEHRIVLTAPQFVSIQPNGGDVLTSFDVLSTAPRELTIRFDQDVDGSQQSLDGIKVFRDGQEISNVSRELGLLGNTVVLRFADTLPDDIYSVQITNDLQNTQGERFDPSAIGNSAIPLNFELDLGTRVSAVVPQPISRSNGQLTHALNQIEIYFNDDELSPSLAGSTDYYQLILTKDTVTNTDDELFTPVSADYSDSEAKVVLTFADDLHTLGGGDGTFRLRVGTNEPNQTKTPLGITVPATEPGDSFDTAYELPALSGTSQILQSTIDVQPFALDFPGSATEPGQNPLSLSFADGEDGVFIYTYNFAETYGDAGSINLITEPQKQRFREAVEIWSQQTGVDAFESATEGDTISVGDPNQGATFDNSVNWNDEFLANGTQGNPSFFNAGAFSYLFGSTVDLSTGDIRFIDNSTEAIFPRNDVLVTAQHAFRPDSLDIDLYKFEVTGSQPGLFSAEILAERADSTSFLDSTLRLYQETAGGSRELIAQNDDYFSEDSFLELSLAPGTYFIGVSSTGNDQYDPSVSGTGIGGTSQGDYELRLDFRADIADSLADSSGVAFDGDSDGTPGGVFNFWFRAAAQSGDEINENEIQQFDLGGATDGNFRIRFDGQLSGLIPYNATAAEVESALESLANIQSGNVSVTGSALPSGPLSIEFTGDLALTDVAQLEILGPSLTGGTITVTTITDGQSSGRTIYVDKTDTTPDNLANVGTIDNPYNVIHAALNLDIDGLPQTGGSSDPNAARAGDIVRILGNGDSAETSIPYEIGLNGFNNQPLADGSKIDIPNNVTVMVDAGAVFKMRRSAIIVGSSSVGIDHSLAAFQVLGTPDQQVVFTSINDLGSGVPVRGDWGGILFAGDLDQDSFRTRYEENGIFLNHIAQADIRFGGGVVNVGSIPQEVAPIDIRDARPTVAFNRLSTNAVAAMTATPDSFEETNFHSSEFQSVRFTSDYSRIGPDIHDNVLSENTINGLFLRVDTFAGSDLVKQTVSGRWDDTDIVHVLSEVLEVQGTPGGPLEDSGTFTKRLDARLSIDPSVIVKLDGARIEVGLGAQLIAEGQDGQQVTFTSVNDDRFGASGSFDTSNNDQSVSQSPGDWGGIYIGHSSTASLDHVMLSYAGGISPVEGAFVGFNAVEIHQADARIANSTFINNASGLVGASGNREGRGINEAATIFVRGAQPVILNNNFLSTDAADIVNPAGVFSDITPAISINANSLNRTYLTDYGRMTGPIDRLEGTLGNQGPLIRNNRLDNNDINGLLIRGETLDGESVWDDTDIVHVLFDPIFIPDLDTFGGLRLESKTEESLVVKMGGNAGFHATGTAGFTNDRIGGSVHVLGQPGRPVILTSIADSTVGAGQRLDGSFQNDTMRAGLGAPDTRGSLDISLNYSTEVSANPLLVAAIEEGARFWETHLTDDISLAFDVFIDFDEGIPGAVASAGAEGAFFDFDTVIAAMQLDAAPDEADLLNRLPSSTEIVVQGPPDDFNADTSGISIGYPNAKALGFGDALTPIPSQVVSGATRDGSININAMVARSSTINDLVPTMIHEIGHTLGFSSGVPEDGDFGEAFTLSTWDLFRMAPGGGASDFTNNPRVVDPDLEQVIYDGGLFDPTGIGIAGLTRGDIPVSRGTAPHPDDGQPSHWRSASAVGMNGINLGIMGPSGGQVTDNDFRSLGLMGWDINSFTLPDVASPGNWEGITLDRFSNDRNVETVVEIEGAETDAGGANGIPDRAEFVGSLAAGEFQGDENLRLGFEIHGVLNSPGDIDVFSFEGIAGTEVWIDVDNTASHLDAVVDLINANASILARSNNSIAGASDLIGSSQVTPELLVDTTGFYPTDHFSVNPKDPGMKLTLPGQAGTRGTYYVRMLSNGSDTQGAYELNVRLREVDEAPGSTIRYADIRFAENGIVADGLAANSPLQSEFVEPGDTTSYELALNLGSPWESNRGEISVSGSLEAVPRPYEDRAGPVDYVEEAGIDWYQFSSPLGFTLDLDFADGLGNPDANIAVYQVGLSDGDVDEIGTDDEITYHLIYFGASSDIEDDQGALTFESSYGSGDPFIGPAFGGHAPSQTLNDGVTIRDIIYGDDFVVAITASQVIPEQLYDQYRTAAYTDQLAASPIQPVITDPIDFVADVSPVGFTLNDLTLYVTADTTAGNGSITQLQSVNPFTGAAQEAARNIADDETGYTLASLGMRPDGSLFSLSLGADPDTSGNFIGIDWALPVDANFNPLPIAENLGDDGIMGFTAVPADDPMDPPTYEEFGDGIQFVGLHISDTIAYGVGDRGGKDAMPAIEGADYLENIVYAIDAYETAIDFNDTAPGTALPTEPIREDDEASATYFGSIPGALTDILEIGAFDTSSGPGGTIQGLVELGGQFYGASDAGGIYQLTPGMPGTAGSTAFLGSIPGASFSGLELGPQNLQNGALASTLFAITSNGDLHAIDLAGNAVPAFANGATSVSTGISDANGLAFSTLDRNLWELEAGESITFTAPELPNSFFTGNQSVLGENFNRDFNYPGGAHGAFDFEVDLTNDAGADPNFYFDYQLRTQFPEQAAAADGRAFTVPNDNDTGATIDDFFEDTNRDTLRIYATTAASPLEPDWVLVATNNLADITNPGGDFQLVSNNVQQLFDNTRLFEDAPDHSEDFFRQARIPLAEFAGEVVTLRVEFNSEGTAFTSDEIDSEIFRPGHNNGDYGHIPLRTDETTDNQVPMEVDADGAFLGVEIQNAFVGNSERGEAVFLPLFSDATNNAVTPRFVIPDTATADTGNYQLYVRPAAIYDPDTESLSPLIFPQTYETNDRFARFEPTGFDTSGVGDTNIFRDQGQLIIHSNRISDSAEFGIRIESAEGVAAGAADLVAENSDRFVRGPVIENNVIANNGLGGIRYAGDQLGIGAVSYGRIVNNTIVGQVNPLGLTNTTVGIEIGPTVAPTLLNNIVAYAGEGISLQASSSAATVIAGNLYHANDIDGPLGQFPITSVANGGIDGSDGLFRNPATGNFFLVDGALAIDSSINAQEDRPSITSVSSSLGLDFVSSILAPDRDGIGQLRIDDPFVESPPGLGSNVIKDRGALERADRVGPRGQLLTPVDNATSDLNSDLNAVRTEAGPFTFFDIRLSDIDFSGNDLNGVGIDDLTVVGAALVISRDNQQLVEGLDYEFSYNSTSDVLTVIPVAGVWVPGFYEIELDNTVITDLAGNSLAANEIDGTTKFIIDLVGTVGPLGDYGDAPLPYPTRFDDGGAAHLDTSTIFLGAGVDTENDGSPSAAADGDTDDGVALSNGLISGITQTIDITASAASFLDAWIDFDGDGVWESNEQIFTSESLTAGVNTLSVSVPSDAVSQTYARFRVSSDATGLAPGGIAADGEVEDYNVSIVEAGFDFGDAPAPYPVASHRVLPGFQLGATVDTESETLTNDAGDDGVVFASTLLAPGSTPSVTVTPSAPGVLEAWIDFNGDGDWDDAGEQLFNGASPLNGTRTLTIDVPSGATLGNTQARFRFSDGSVTLGPAGTADNGEVEDYTVAISDPTSDWHNEALPEDVNASGVISPLDALLVINELNDRVVSDPVTGMLNLPANPPPFVDVNNDGIISPTDAITVINAINPTNPSALTAPTGGNSASDTGPLTAPLSSSVVTSDGIQNSEQHNDLALRSYQPTEAASNESYIRRDTNETEENDLLDDFFASL